METTAAVSITLISCQADGMMGGGSSMMGAGGLVFDELTLLLSSAGVGWGTVSGEEGGGGH